MGCLDMDEQEEDTNKVKDADDSEESSQDESSEEEDAEESDEESDQSSEEDDEEDDDEEEEDEVEESEEDEKIAPPVERSCQKPMSEMRELARASRKRISFEEPLAEVRTSAGNWHEEEAPSSPSLMSICRDDSGSPRADSPSILVVDD